MSYDPECEHPWHDNPALISPCPECGAQDIVTIAANTTLDVSYNRTSHLCSETYAQLLAALEVGGCQEIKRIETAPSALKHLMDTNLIDFIHRSMDPHDTIDLIFNGASIRAPIDRVMEEDGKHVTLVHLKDGRTGKLLTKKP